MDEFDPSPPTADVDAARSRWLETTDTFGRVHDVILGVTAPTDYTEIADLAHCSPNAAKKHLDRLTELGLARADRDSRPPRYERNDGYLEWQEASRIAQELTVEEIIERVEALEAERADFEARFGTTDPTTVSVFDGDEHDTIHDRMAAVADWQRLDRDIRLLEIARQLAQNDGHLLPA